MAFPRARMARSTTFPLTISAREFGKSALTLGGRPTCRDFSNFAAYVMDGLLAKGVTPL